MNWRRRLVLAARSTAAKASAVTRLDAPRPHPARRGCSSAGWGMHQSAKDRTRSGGWRGCLHDFPLPSLRRCSQIAVRFILVNLQRAEHAVEVSRFGRVAIGAAEARMNHPEVQTRELHSIVQNDRYPLSPRIVALKEILGQLRPEPEREPLPPRRHYEPPSKGRYSQRG